MGLVGLTGWMGLAEWRVGGRREAVRSGGGGGLEGMQVQARPAAWLELGDGEIGMHLLCQAIV